MRAASHGDLSRAARDNSDAATLLPEDEQQRQQLSRLLQHNSDKISPSQSTFRIDIPENAKLARFARAGASSAPPLPDTHEAFVATHLAAPSSSYETDRGRSLDAAGPSSAAAAPPPPNPAPLNPAPLSTTPPNHLQASNDAYNLLPRPRPSPPAPVPVPVPAFDHKQQALEAARERSAQRERQERAAATAAAHRRAAYPAAPLSAPLPPPPRTLADPEPGTATNSSVGTATTAAGTPVIVNTRNVDLLRGSALLGSSTGAEEIPLSERHPLERREILRRSRHARGASGGALTGGGGGPDRDKDKEERERLVDNDPGVYRPRSREGPPDEESAPQYELVEGEPIEVDLARGGVRMRGGGEVPGVGGGMMGELGGYERRGSGRRRGDDGDRERRERWGF